VAGLRRRQVEGLEVHVVVDLPLGRESCHDAALRIKRNCKFLLCVSGSISGTLACSVMGMIVYKIFLK
jgi:hypothetical protein